MKEIMKQTKKTEKMRQLTDAELRQITGGGEVEEFEKQDCYSEYDKESCEQLHYCAWVHDDDKDSHYYCTWIGGPS